MSGTCEACKPGFFDHDSKCLSVCPDGLYGDVATYKCLPCNDKCTKCTGPAINEC